MGRETQHRPVEYGGPGEAFVRTVANLAYGGQVVLTERAWVSVQDKIPGQAQVSARFQITCADGFANQQSAVYQSAFDRFTTKLQTLASHK